MVMFLFLSLISPSVQRCAFLPLSLWKYRDIPEYPTRSNFNIINCALYPNRYLRLLGGNSTQSQFPNGFVYFLHIHRNPEIVFPLVSLLSKATNSHAKNAITADNTIRKVRLSKIDSFFILSVPFPQAAQLSYFYLSQQSLYAAFLVLLLFLFAKNFMTQLFSS